MPRGIPKRAVDRLRKWDAKVTPDYWAFTIRATKDMAFEKMAQYQADYEAILRNVKTVLQRYPGEAFRTQEYMWYALKLYHCLRVYRSRALVRCANAALVSFAVLGLNTSALYEIAGALGVKPDPLEKIVAGLAAGVGIMAGTPKTINRVDGPVPVTSTEPQVVARVTASNILYIEGVRVTASNPSGSGVTLYLRPYLLHSMGRTPLSPLVEIPEGQSLDDWIRWPLDEVPDGAELQGAELEAYVSTQPSPGLEPTAAIQVTGTILEQRTPL